MVPTYEWVTKKLNYDIKNSHEEQIVFALINEDGYYSNYFFSVDKMPSPYKLKLYNQTLKKMTLKDLHAEIHCSNSA